MRAHRGDVVTGAEKPAPVFAGMAEIGIRGCLGSNPLVLGDGREGSNPSSGKYLRDAARADEPVIRSVPDVISRVPISSRRAKSGDQKRSQSQGDKRATPDNSSQ
jgi:hypothetical protein